MAKGGINKVILVGHLGNDPETRYMPSGGAVTSISIATTAYWKDKQTGQQNELTEWHKVVFFNRLAEIAGEYLRKGKKVYVEGSLRTRKWQDQNGQDRWTTEIVANDMLLLDSHGSGNTTGHRDDHAAPPASATRTPGQGAARTPPAPSANDWPDDDIPF